MTANTKIEWADYTFNPWIGDDDSREKTSASYWKQPLKWNREAEDPVKGGMVPGDIDGANPGQHYLRPGDDRTFVCMASHAERGVWLTCGEKDEDEWYCKTPEEFAEAGWLPQRHRPRVASLADVFEDWGGAIVDHKGCKGFVDGEKYRWHSTPADEEYLAKMGMRAVTMNDLRSDLFNLIDATPNLDWLLLTKRPENVRQMWPTSLYEQEAMSVEAGTGGSPMRRNVWLGTSMSDQATADKAIPELLKCRDLSPVLFASYEPPIGPVDWNRLLFEGMIVDHREPAFGGPGYGLPDGKRESSLKWIIVGGESGPKTRSCNIKWIESTIDQCREAGVPCFVQWPENLRVREFPDSIVGAPLIP